MPLSIHSTLSPGSTKEAHAASKPRIPSPLRIRTSFSVLSIFFQLFQNFEWQIYAEPNEKTLRQIAGNIKPLMICFYFSSSTSIRASIFSKSGRCSTRF